VVVIFNFFQTSVDTEITLVNKENLDLLFSFVDAKVKFIFHTIYVPRLCAMNDIKNTEIKS
jgi:hypothetical protein